MSSDLHLADYLTEKKLAEQLRRHERTVARWRLRRRGPRFSVIGREVIYSQADVSEWLRDGGTIPQRSKPARAR
jgi:hypothetical protein